MKRILACLVVALALATGTVLRADPPRRPRASAATQAAPPAGTSDIWQVTYLGKNRIGYSHTLSRPVQIDGKPLIKTDAETHLTIKRFGQTLQIETREEEEELPGGELVSFIYEVKNPPAAPTRTVGRVRGSLLVGESTVAGTPHEFSLPWQAATKSTAYVDRYPRVHPFKPGDAVNLRVFMPDQMQLSDVRFRAMRRESVAGLDGRRRSLLRVNMVESVMPQSPVEVYLDEHGDPVVSTTEMLGQTLTTYTVPAEVAVKEIAGEGLDIAVNTLVRTTAIPRAHFTTRAVYRIKMKGEDPTPFFPMDANQKVIRTGPDECEITVHCVRPTTSNRSIRIRPAIPRALAVSAVERPRSLESCRSGGPLPGRAVKDRHRDGEVRRPRGAKEGLFDGASLRGRGRPDAARRLHRARGPLGRHAAGLATFRRRSWSGWSISSRCLLLADTCGRKPCSATIGYRSTRRWATAKRASERPTSSWPNRASPTRAPPPRLPSCR